MKIRLHHIEMCVRDPNKILCIFRDHFGLLLVGRRETESCEQLVVQMERTIFIITCRKEFKALPRVPSIFNLKERSSEQDQKHGKNNNYHLPNSTTEEPWTIFCCENTCDSSHIDSVFNIALEVDDLKACVSRLSKMGNYIIRSISRVDCEYGSVSFAIIKSCCGNVVHTLVQKSDYTGWFLPGFTQLTNIESNEVNSLASATHFDHVALACRVGETNEIIEWYEKAFDMKRFISNAQETKEDGLVIGDDVGMRLKVMQFWKCSESGLASASNDSWETLKIVVAESLPMISNTQIENFLNGHGGPGLQHVGLHTSHMVQTVESMFSRGVKFRQPPPTYYTPVGQLNVIESVGEDVEMLRKFGILLDDEADVFEEENENRTPPKSRYLMQIFTHPIFDRDTFFLEVIQRKGALGFGIGNVTALARSVNAYNLEMMTNGSIRC